MKIMANYGNQKKVGTKFLIYKVGIKLCEKSDQHKMWAGNRIFEGLQGNFMLKHQNCEVSFAYIETLFGVLMDVRAHHHSPSQ